MKRPQVEDPAWARTAEPLLWLIGSGHQVITPESGYYYDCRRRTDRHIGLQLTLRGEGFYERAGVTTRLTPGMAFFEPMPGDFRYGYPQHASAAYEHVWIDLGGGMATTLWRQVVGASGSPVLDLGPDNPVAPLMLTLAHEHAHGLPHDRYQVSARIYEIIMVVCSVIGRSRFATSHLVQRALKRIHHRGLNPDLDVSTLAAELGVSREHFARAFTAATGLSPMQYLMQHRLRAVQEALRGTSDPLEAIARRCGFSGANYLCRAFRAHLGITPNAYRCQPWVVHTAQLVR